MNLRLTNSKIEGGNMKLFRKSLSILVAVFLLFGVYTMPAQALTADDASRDYPVANMTLSVNSEEVARATNVEGPASYAVDDNPATFWHTNWDADLSGSETDRTATLTLAEEVELDALRYLTRPSTGAMNDPINGAIM